MTPTDTPVVLVRRSRVRPQAQCPIRPGEPCTLCQVDVTGPQDCGLVYLVMGDEELRAGLHAKKLESARPARVPGPPPRAGAGLPPQA